MQTLTVTAARQNPGRWLKRTLKGEDVGMMIDGALVALCLVKLFSEAYAEHEHGAAAGNLDNFAGRANKELDADRKAGWLKPFSGKLKR